MHNPVKGVKRPAANNNEGKPPALTNDQARQLLETPPEDTVKGQRDRAILATLLYQGLRRQELCNLRVKDYQRRSGVMMFHVHGKRKKERFVPVEPKTQRLLAQYLETAGHGTQAEFDRLDEILSNYRQDCAIEHFNNVETTVPVVVDVEIAALVQTARQVSVASQGCYDLTIKPLFDLWGFAGHTLTPPHSSRLERQLQHIGFSKLETPTPSQLRKTDPQVHVDLSSIAQGQGYSVGRIAAVVDAAGIQNYLVEIGGERQTRGHKPDSSSWRIGVERPLPGGHAVQKALTIRQDAPVSVMTSGTYRHYFDAQASRSHTIRSRSQSSTTIQLWRMPGPRRCPAWDEKPVCWLRMRTVSPPCSSPHTITNSKRPQLIAGVQ